MEKSYLTIGEIQDDLSSGKISCRHLIENYLQKIHERDDLNVFLETYKEEALNRADEIDQKLKDGNCGKLAGLVIGLKDNICYKGHRVSASSKILEGFESLFSATLVERLLEEDAIIIGRLNCDEFAMGSSNENSAFGAVKNPLDPNRVTGGSSGGSAAAVAAGMCHATIGTDTGGSIRQPASFCGIVGFKPTYGRVSRYGLVAYGSSFDQAGPLTKSIEDAASILEVIAGKDDFDSTAASIPVDEYTQKLDFDKSVKIAYPVDCLTAEGLDKEIKELTHQVLDNLKSNGHTVSESDFPYLDYVVPTYQIISNAEASSNLSRYDGILYGYRSKEAESLEDTLVASRTEGFGDEVKRRIMLGTFVLSEGYYDAYYAKAQRVRRLIREHTEQVLHENDFIVLPTTPGTAFPLGEKANDPISMYLEDIFTLQASLSGYPAVSIPIGKHSNGLPFGLQIIGNKFGEADLLAFSKYLMGFNS